MTSDTEIVNRALQHLGASRIESLDEGTPSANAMRSAFAPVRDRLLREHPWNFAVKRAQVPASDVQTSWGGLTRFPKPEDFLRLLRGKEAGTGGVEETKTWQIEGQWIVTTASAPLEYRYIARIDDPNQYDPMFAELLALSLAVELGGGELPVSASTQQLLERRWFDLFARAKKANAFENPSVEPPTDPWLLERL